MKKGTVCPKCGSDKMMSQVSLIDHNGELLDRKLSAFAQRNPGAWFFTGDVEIPLEACICRDCGYVELYVTDPHTLWDALQEGSLRE